MRIRRITQGKQHGWLIFEQKHHSKQVAEMLTRTKDAPKPSRRLPKSLAVTKQECKRSQN